MLLQHVQDSIAGYAETAKICTIKLERLFNDLEIPEEEQAADIFAVIHEAQTVWANAVEKAEAKRRAMQQQADDIMEEVQRIKIQLGAVDPGTEGTIHAEGPTVKSALDAAAKQLAVWREKKHERQQAYDEIMACMTNLRQQLGYPVMNVVPDLTRAGMDYMALEREKLLAEQSRRLTQLHQSMSDLKKICVDILGEELISTAAKVHPSLRHYSSDEGMVGSSSSGGSSSTTAQAPDTLFMVDLSVPTLEGLKALIKEMHEVKVSREQQLSELHAVLVSLWEAVHVPEEASQRAGFAALMTGPNRLHTANVDKIMCEVHRLEECRSQAMRDLTVEKARELRQALQDTHLPAPLLEDILADLGKAGHSGSPGKISDCLGKVVRQLADVQKQAERRRPLVHAIRNLKTALDETMWLREYECDVDRFKGRDSNVKLQRSIKAQKCRDSLCGMLAGLRQQLESWALTEGQPFMYDGHVAAESLDSMLHQVDAVIQAERAVLANRSAVKAGHLPPHGGTPISSRTPAGHRALASTVTPQGLLKKNMSVQLSAGKAHPAQHGGNDLRRKSISQLSSSMKMDTHDAHSGMTGGAMSGSNMASAMRTPPRPATSYNSRGSVTTGNSMAYPSSAEYGNKRYDSHNNQTGVNNYHLHMPAMAQSPPSAGSVTHSTGGPGQLSARAGSVVFPGGLGGEGAGYVTPEMFKNTDYLPSSGIKTRGPTQGSEPGIDIFMSSADQAVQSQKIITPVKGVATTHDTPRRSTATDLSTPQRSSRIPRPTIA